MTTEEKVAHDALLTQMKEAAKNEIETRGYQNAEGVKSAISKELEGMNLEALRAYESDKTVQNDSLKKIAGEVEKLQHRSNSAADAKADPIREILDANMKEIEKRFKNIGQKDEFKFDIQTRNIMTVINTVDSASLAVPVAMVESMSMEAYVPKRRGIQFINDIADRKVVAKVDQYKTWLEEGNETGAFAIVAEGGLKPLVSAGLVRNFTKVKKIAGKYVVTEEFTKFYAEAYSIIQRIIADKLVRDYSALLVIDLNAQSAAYTSTAMNAQVPLANDYDAVAAVASQIMALNFVPDVLIVNPADLWRIRLLKDTTGTYLFPVQNSTGQIDMFGFNVIVSTFQVVGQFTLGESKLFKIEEEPITVRLGYGIESTSAVIGTSGASAVTAVSSDVDTNRFRVIVETFFLDWIATPHIGSFVKATFAAVKTAILKP